MLTPTTLDLNSERDVNEPIYVVTCILWICNLCESRLYVHLSDWRPSGTFKDMYWSTTYSCIYSSDNILLCTVVVSVHAVVYQSLRTCTETPTCTLWTWTDPTIEHRETNSQNTQRLSEVLHSAICYTGSIACVTSVNQ